jgi:dihydroflavonol-4-reductase
VKTVLVTGASSFLGYHVVKQLNERGIRPRVIELPGASRDVLKRLDVDQCAGELDHEPSVRAACASVDTLVHLAFKVSVGGGATLIDDMRRVNVDGTRRLLEAANAAGVQRAVVAGSALAVAVSREATPLAESDAAPENAFDLPYASIRREAELSALAQSGPGFDVVSVCPAFTFGPDDPTGAPANKLLQAIITRKIRFTLPVGFGCLDVRDFAAGALLAAERGRAGERYLLSGENITATELVERAAALVGVRPARFTPPTFLLHAGVAALELICKLRGKPAPITRDVLQIIGRYAWYDTSKARTQLGWTTRPLQQTLVDTIAWLRETHTTAPRASVSLI